MLTRRGWALCVAAAFMVVAGAVVGVSELFALAVAAATLVAFSAAWVLTRRWDVETARDLRPARVAAGEVVVVELAVRNRSRRRSPALVAVDANPGATGDVRLLVAPLDPGQVEKSTYRIPTTERGVFVVGPLELALRDPFGLVATTRRASATSTVVVHPQVVVVRPPTTRLGGDRRSGSGGRRAGVAGEDFFALRDYRVGDDLRRVHWAATARADRLMIRQEEVVQPGRLVVALDLRAPAWEGRDLEPAISAAASLAVAAARSGLSVRVVDTSATTGGTVVGSGVDRGLLDQLARAAPHVSTGLLGPALLGALGGDVSPTVVVTSDHDGDAGLRALARTLPDRQLTVVAFGGPSPLPGPDGAGTSAPRRATVVRVPAGVPFGIAWESGQRSADDRRRMAEGHGG